MKSERSPIHDQLMIADIAVPEIEFSSDTPGLITSFPHIPAEIQGARTGTLWRNLSYQTELSPYCRSYTAFWKYPLLGYEDVHVEHIPAYIVTRTNRDTAGLTPIGTQDILFKNAGDYHSGLFIASSNDRLVPYRVSPVVIGRTGNSPVFDYRRFDREQDMRPPGITLVSAVSAEFLGITQDSLQQWKEREHYLIDESSRKC